MSRVVTRLLVVLCAAAVLVAGCGSPAAAPSNPDDKARAVTRQEGGVRVSTSVLSTEESAAIHGAPLAAIRASDEASPIRDSRAAIAARSARTCLP